MKKYSVFSLYVIKIEKDHEVQYFICKRNDRTNTYIEVFTNEKITIEDKNCVEPLSNYYSILALRKYPAGKPLMLDKKDLLRKYLEINREVTFEQFEESQNENGKKYFI